MLNVGECSIPDFGECSIPDFGAQLADYRTKSLIEWTKKKVDEMEVLSEDVTEGMSEVTEGMAKLGVSTATQ